MMCSGNPGDYSIPGFFPNNQLYPSYGVSTDDLYPFPNFEDGETLSNESPPELSTTADSEGSTGSSEPIDAVLAIDTDRQLPGFMGPQIGPLTQESVEDLGGPFYPTQPDLDITLEIDRYIGSHTRPISGRGSLIQSNESLYCPYQCTPKKFGRKAEKERHIKEQHKCPWSECKDKDFPSGKGDHEDKHPVGFKCGSCALAGIPVNVFKRSDKFRNHCKEKHGPSNDSTFFQFKCDTGSCYIEKDCGGVFFMSEHDLRRHTRSKHTNVSVRLPGIQNEVEKQQFVQHSRTLPPANGNSQIGMVKHSLDNAHQPIRKRTRPLSDPPSMFHTGFSKK